MKVKRWVLPVFEEFWNDYIKNGGVECTYEFDVKMSNHILNIFLIPSSLNQDIIMVGVSIRYSGLDSILFADGDSNLYVDGFYKDVDWVDATEESIFKWYSSLESRINKK